MVVKIKQKIFLLIIIGNVLFSFGQNSTVRGPEPLQTILVTCHMVFYPKNTLHPIIRNEFCENESKTFFLNGLELPFDSLMKLQLTYKNTLKKQSFYELKYKENNTSNCIEHINYYITIKIPIFLNGKEIPLENGFEILGAITPSEIVSIQRRNPHSKKKGRIEIISLAMKCID